MQREHGMARGGGRPRPPQYEFQDLGSIMRFVALTQVIMLVPLLALMYLVPGATDADGAPDAWKPSPPVKGAGAGCTYLRMWC